MDEIVLKAMARWPNVPHAFGWLSLDARGNWRLKGDRIANPAVAAFISRNYSRDDRGRWFFQNGPQRVFVTLACAPYVFAIMIDGDRPSLLAHTGQPAFNVSGAYIDDAGRILVMTELGIGVVNDRDLALLADAFVDADGAPFDGARLARWLEDTDAPDAPRLAWGDRQVTIEAIGSSGIPERFGFDPDPRPDPGQPEC